MTFNLNDLTLFLFTGAAEDEAAPGEITPGKVAPGEATCSR
jgi:hypothetical protein